MSGVVLLADETSDIWGGWSAPGSTAGQVVLVIGALCLVVIAVFIWAAFIRKPRRQRAHTYHGTSSEDGGPPRRHKRRSLLSRALGKRRHRHRRRRGEGRERPLNPTLAQVGGLPQPQSRRESPPDS